MPIFSPRLFLGSAALFSIMPRTLALDTPIRGFVDVLEGELGGGGRKDDEEEYDGFYRDGETTRTSATQATGTLITALAASSTSLLASSGTRGLSTHTQSTSTLGDIVHSPSSLPFTTSNLSTGMTSSDSPFTAATATVSGVSTGAYMPPEEATQWKVIGLVFVCIAFVVVTSLTIVFWDTWIGFLKSILCCRRRKGTRELGEEDLIPDWEKGSWEFRLATEEGHRYPTMESLERVARAEAARQDANNTKGQGGHVKGVGLGVGMGENPFEPQGRPMGTSPGNTSPFLDPHPLEPLTRRPSTNSARSARRIV